jgi:stearoyl-CoA desaturase (delta-9 desaturase)
LKAANADPREKDWIRIAFFILTPVLGVLGTAAHAWRFGVRWWEPAVFLTLYALVGVSVTAGYHRLFAHRSYECHPAVQAFYLFFGAMALQNSILAWGSDHRIHHRYVDHDWDPYNIQRGGLWAHIVWIFYKDRRDRTFDDVPDLQRNPLVRWQHRHAAWIGIVVGLGLPTAIGLAMGDALGGLLWGGFLRVVVIHHTTFFVNSIAHLFGTQPYSEASSARDNPWVAFLTNGEGYHNFHHRFPTDFRNGIRWWQWDPTKWWIRSLEALHLARGLRRTSALVIERSRLQTAVARLESRMASAPSHVLDVVRRRLDAGHRSLELAAARWTELREVGRRSWNEHRGHLAEARRQRREALRTLDGTFERV